MSTKAVKDVPTLAEFIKAKKRIGCSVCKLPVEIRAQIGRAASEKHISRDLQVEWVSLVAGHPITSEELMQHVNGRHDA